MGLFSKFAFAFGLNKKNKYLPVGLIGNGSNQNTDVEMPIYPATPYKTIASFDLKVEEPKYQGAIPNATIKFYPFN